MGMVAAASAVAERSMVCSYERGTFSSPTSTASKRPCPRRKESNPLNGFHKRVVIGVEIEAYGIGASDYQIGRRLSRPRPGV